MTAAPDRLPFVLQDFTREPAWSSRRAMDVWAPRVDRCVKAWATLERESVGRARNAGLFFATAAELPALREWADSRRLAVLSVSFEGASRGAYSSSSRPFEPGGQWRARLVVGQMRPETLEAQQAFMDRDEVALGQLLGYPRCCAEFYERFWKRDGWLDTTWPMAGNTTWQTVDGVLGLERAVTTRGERCLEERAIVPAAASPCEANILLRWLGIRLVPHLPCSFSCQASAAMGARWAALATEIGLEEESAWLREMLSWPVEWTALHGIAEVKTPVLKVMTRTDASAHRWAVQREGTVYPVEGATGLAFPFQRARTSRRQLPVTESRSFAAAIENAKPSPAPASMDNGFATAGAEASAHAVVLRAAAQLRDVAGVVLDLGCGNGKLVLDVCTSRDDRTPAGVELVAERAGRAQASGVSVVCGDLSGVWPFAAPSMVLFMPGRLLEIAEPARGELAGRLARCGAQLIVYAYGDVLARHGGLAKLVREAMPGWWLGVVERGQGAEAAVARPLAGGVAPL